jgi:hypothetical protein
MTLSNYQPPRVSFDKVSDKPYKRSLPEPFQRPKIELSEVKREWQWVYPSRISRFDTIVDKGLVDKIEEMNSGYLFSCRGGDIHVNHETKLFAFTRVVESPD